MFNGILLQFEPAKPDPDGFKQLMPRNLRTAKRMNTFVKLISALSFCVLLCFTPNVASASNCGSLFENEESDAKTPQVLPDAVGASLLMYAGRYPLPGAMIRSNPLTHRFILPINNRPHQFEVAESATLPLLNTRSRFELSEIPEETRSEFRVLGAYEKAVSASRIVMRPVFSVENGKMRMVQFAARVLIRDEKWDMHATYIQRMLSSQPQKRWKISEFFLQLLRPLRPTDEAQDSR